MPCNSKKLNLQYLGGLLIMTRVEKLEARLTKAKVSADRRAEKAAAENARRAAYAPVKAANDAIAVAHSRVAEIARRYRAATRAGVAHGGSFGDAEWRAAVQAWVDAKNTARAALAVYMGQPAPAPKSFTWRE